MLLGILFWHYTDLIWFEHFYIFPTCEWFLNSDHKTWSEVKSQSVVSDSLQPHGLYSSWNSSGQNTGKSSFSLFQGIFPTKGSNSALPHCRQILYQLSHKGRLRILQWVAYPFSRSSRPRNQTRVSCIAGRFFTNWSIREASNISILLI